MKFTTYKNHQPLGTHECPDWEVATVSGGNPYIEGWATENQYILNGQFVDRPPKTSSCDLWNWDTCSWEPDEELAVEASVNKRNQLLLESDWTQLPDAPCDKAAWVAYRQSLRDLTAQTGYPFEIIWPVKPE